MDQFSHELLLTFKDQNIEQKYKKYIFPHKNQIFFYLNTGMLIMTIPLFIKGALDSSIYIITYGLAIFLIAVLSLSAIKIFFEKALDFVPPLQLVSLLILNLCFYKLYYQDNIIQDYKSKKAQEYSYLFSLCWNLYGYFVISCGSSLIFNFIAYTLFIISNIIVFNLEKFHYDLSIFSLIIILLGLLLLHKEMLFSKTQFSKTRAHKKNTKILHKLNPNGFIILEHL